MSVSALKEHRRKTNVSQTGAFLEIKQQKCGTADVVFERRTAAG
jgi:ribosomal protein S27E